jgi:hypothetical protein
MDGVAEGRWNAHGSPAGTRPMARVVGGSDSGRKRELAVDFIRRIRAMDRDELHDLILSQAGEELARFFLDYATDLMEREPQRAAENASSLLLIGYLLRCFEEGDGDRRALVSNGAFLQ